MKTALVTGGSRGIGSAIALGLGKNFHVVVGYANSEDKANNVVKEIVAAGGSASTVQIDISNAESVDNAFSIVEKEYNSGSAQTEGVFDSAWGLVNTKYSNKGIHFIGNRECSTYS